MPHLSLKDNSLYIVLYIRQDPPVPDDFHWALYLHRNGSTGGKKYHVVNQSSGWIPSHAVTRGIFNEFLLVGWLRIADIPDGRVDEVDRILTTYDDKLNDIEGVTCRVWLFKVLGLLQRGSGDERVLKCENLPGLEREAKDWGNSHARGAAMNEQPRPLGESSLRGL